MKMRVGFLEVEDLVLLACELRDRGQGELGRLHLEV